MITDMSLVAAAYKEQMNKKRTNGCANHLPFQSQPD